ncbi:HAMP domain-containing histidine kinase [Sphingobacterium sp. lm-10]|uniref:sensor histidine kinase n=1 Tax=Sphingobacterium sp. lm-10 TaxID=2944904 RepID=UPI002021859B|nr:HAMP domain-containing sensor histidine kinase [Sphingobacterium sp. lm-10]MCL7988546.1 HAMP domain-containing histidine kinase [Sphingobacterium sp. lm-10]
MLKNHKILAVLIVVITAGILSVLSFWLYNSYDDHRELTFAKADQALLSTLNDYYARHEITANNSRNSYQKNLVADINRAYPNVAVDSIYAWMEKNATRRHDSIRHQYREMHRNIPKERSMRRKPREINHWMLQGRDAQLSTAALDTLLKEYKEELSYQGIHLANAQLRLQKVDRKDYSDLRENHTKNILTTRPILINAEGNLYLYAELSQTWRHIVSNMLGQIIFSALLVMALIGTFLALFKTIRKQNKLAMLQRSFVTNMTHELKTPLSTVTAAVEALQRFGAKNDPDRWNKYLTISKRELDHLSQMVESVLQFNSDVRSGIDFNDEEFDLQSLLQEIVDSFQLVNAAQIDLLFDTPQSPLLFSGDKAHLRNTFSNVIDNAIKYNQSTSPQVKVSLMATQKALQIRISDNGIGIPKLYQKNIYDLFFRVPNGELYSVKGFGLGLAYVQQVVHQHGGSITVDSTEGIGTTFTISFPRK